MKIAIKELLFSSIDVISACKVCNMLNVSVEEYFFTMGDC